MRGFLTKMECSEKGTTLYVNAGLQKVVLHTTKPQGVEFISYVSGVGEAIECKEYDPGRYVRILYRNSADVKAKYKGEPRTVEFLKPEHQ